MNAKSLAVLEFDKVRRRLADHTVFSGGRRLALDLAPSTDAPEVRRRLGLTAEAREYADRRGNPGLEGAHDLRDEIEGALRGKILLPRELLEIRDTLGAARRMGKAIGRERARWPGLGALAERLEPCSALYDAIHAVFDEAGEVVDRASPNLRRIRTEMRTAHERMRRQIDGIMGSAREYLQEPLVTQRNGRYVIPVKSDFRGRVPGVVHDVSDSGATLFVEPLGVVEAGNHLRQLEIEEEREVDRILRELAGDVAAEADALRDTIAALADLDLAFAMAGYGYALRAVTPEVLDADRPFLDYPAARHPLIDPEHIVAVDVRVGEDFRQLIITGPNTGGKTVSLKTIGLLTLMAQSGLQVPAGEGARLAVFDGVYADIGDEQSIEQSLSTFSGHLTNIVGILGEATGASLVLLDELGAGTDPVEGAALAAAILDALRARGIATAASTHYSELKVYAHGTHGVANASVEFDLETLRPTYELTIGIPGRSNALAIAERLGLPAPIIAAARGGLAVTDVAMEDLLAEIKALRDQTVADRAAAASARHEAETWARRLEQGVRDFEIERTDLLRQARAQAEGELDAARQALRKLMRRAERDVPTTEALGAVRASLDEIGTILASEMPRPAEVVAPERAALVPGAQVRLVRFNQTGEVVRVLGDAVEVQVGRMKMSAPLAEVEVLGPPPERLAPDAKLVRSAAAPATVPIELDLRGMRVDDGLDAMDRYLGEALLAGLPWVRVIHGHGTGAMKAAVREALRHYRFVQRVRGGGKGEGGDGATVVHLEA